MAKLDINKEKIDEGTFQGELERVRGINYKIIDFTQTMKKVFFISHALVK